MSHNQQISPFHTLDLTKSSFVDMQKTLIQMCAHFLTFQVALNFDFSGINKCKVIIYNLFFLHLILN